MGEAGLGGLALPSSSWTAGAVADALRRTDERTAAVIPATADILSVVKGLEHETLLRMSEVIVEAGGVPLRRIAALSGPNLAAEIARGWSLPLFGVGDLL